MKIAIVGWGLEGQSAFRYFGPEHEYLIVNDEPRDDFPPQSDKIHTRFLHQSAPPGVPGQVNDSSYMAGIEECDKIIYQPTAYFKLRERFGDDRHFWDKATTILDIFLETCPTKNIIGVTGSKGKGTTSTLIAEMIRKTGMNAHLGGNIGVPVLDMLNKVKENDWVVLELANFQLKSAKRSPRIAVCLLITPEHLDWHPDVEDYIQAKANMFRNQTKDDIAIYFEDSRDSKRIAGYSPGRKIPYFEKPGGQISPEGKVVIDEAEIEIINRSEIKLLGEHNLQNVCAAVTAVWFGLAGTDGHIKAGAMRQVLSTFNGLEHRLELVRELNGVTYYDDSFGTTPDTTIVALKAVIQPAVLILGGHDKGLNYDELIDEIAVRDRVRHVITIGEIGPRLAQMLRDKHFKAITEGLKTMPEIVAEARARAQPGDAVLLSCGTSSFGLFHNYKDRGDQFKKSVQSLA
ncbi:MAG TPA: UDP-N-acetylmuramoyl-L-alanine--D-glutamate ligase [Candidatus Saccharimonadales bacterium]|nr:UDP-N-acetylmuramoyl-L-alanine--D-glutamate ligase [Candidatus Saccharimonadales bacterium]